MSTSLLTRPRRLAAIVAALVASLAFTAAAQAKEPTGDFAVFKQCPRFTAKVESCIFAVTESGEVSIGSTSVAIKNPIDLQAGVVFNEDGTESIVGALNGETLTRAPQPVPGGLLGVVA